MIRVKKVQVGDYIACSDGRIFKKNWGRTGRTKEVGQSYNKNGYLKFNFNLKMMYSHRFIAMCFIPNPSNLPEVNHKNEIKDDNRVENLEWCDRKYNNNYGTRKNKYQKPVVQLTKSGEFVAEYQSAAEAGRETHIDRGHINDCCRGKYKSAGGYIWRYKEDV